MSAVCCLFLSNCFPSFRLFFIRGQRFAARSRVRCHVVSVAIGPEWVQFPPPRSTARAWQLQGASPLRFAYIRPGDRIWVCYCSDCLITAPQLLSLDGKVFGLCRKDWTLDLRSRFEVTFRNAQLRVGYQLIQEATRGFLITDDCFTSC